MPLAAAVKVQRLFAVGGFDLMPSVLAAWRRTMQHVLQRIKMIFN